MSRLNFVDAFKGLCILLIVIAHIPTTSVSQEVRDFNSSIMITGFYLTSAFFFSLREPLPPVNQHMSKRWRQLMLPYIYLSIILFIIDLVLYWLGFIEVENVYADVLKTLSLRGIGTLWFLPALFVGELFFLKFIELSRRAKVGLFLIILSSMFLYKQWAETYAYIDFYYRVIDLPFRTVDNMLTSIFVIILFYCIFTSKLWRNHQEHTTIKLLTVFLFWFVIKLALVFFSGNEYMVFLIEKMLIVVSPLMVFLGFEFVYKFINVPFLVYWGRNSFVLMAFHYTLHVQIIALAYEAYYGESMTSFISLVATLCITLVLTVPLVRFFNVNYGFILGK